MKYLFLLLPFPLFSQITHLKTVTCRVKEFGERELICVTFYQGAKVGYDLATHDGNFIGKCEILSVRSSDCPIDSTVVPKLIRAFREREERRRNTSQGQAIIAGTSLLIVKAMLDSKLDWRWILFMLFRCEMAAMFNFPIHSEWSHSNTPIACIPLGILNPKKRLLSERHLTNLSPSSNSTTNEIPIHLSTVLCVLWRLHRTSSCRCYWDDTEPGCWRTLNL